MPRFPTLNYRELPTPIRRCLGRHGGRNGKRGVHKLPNGPSPVRHAKQASTSFSGTGLNEPLKKTKQATPYDAVSRCLGRVEDSARPIPAWQWVEDYKLPQVIRCVSGGVSGGRDKGRNRLAPIWRCESAKSAGVRDNSYPASRNHEAMVSYLILPPRGSMCRSTDAPSSCVCLAVTLLGDRVAVLAMAAILGDVIGCTVTFFDGGVGGFGGRFFAIGKVSPLCITAALTQESV